MTRERARQGYVEYLDPPPRRAAVDVAWNLVGAVLIVAVICIVFSIVTR